MNIDKNYITRDGANCRAAVVGGHTADASYTAQLNSLASKEYTGAKLGLTRVRQALRELGNPHDRFPTIHIAGTNGKGSTAALLYNVLMAAGFRVGFYTSPHFLDYRERIRINEQLIPQRQLKQVLAATFSTSVGGELTYFEVLTVAAFKYFADAKIDVLVCEVGLGGRLDATNIIKKPLVSIITSIDYDHTEFLGNSLAAIAHEKAGIIKRGVPVVVNTGHRAADEVIKERCAKLKVRPYFLGKDFGCRKAGVAIDWKRKEQRFSYFGIKNNCVDVRLQLLGAHQVRNASLALAALELIGDKLELILSELCNEFCSRRSRPAVLAARTKTRGGNVTVHHLGINEQTIRRGLQQARWAGRLDIRENIVLPQTQNSGKCSGKSSGDRHHDKSGGDKAKSALIKRTVILDGAHNAAGAKVLRTVLASSPYTKTKNGIVVIMSVLRDKNYRAICRQLQHIASKVIVFTAHSARALPGETLRGEWLKYLPENKVLLAPGLASSFHLLQKGDKVICVTGSLYGISEMLGILEMLEMEL